VLSHSLVFDDLGSYGQAYNFVRVPVKLVRNNLDYPTCSVFATLARFQRIYRHIISFLIMERRNKVIDPIKVDNSLIS